MEPSYDSLILQYYHTNYTTCPKDTSYFSTWQFLATFTHSIMIIQIPLVILTGYCILKKTPRAMGSLKWAMLNVHIWSTYMDILVCSLITPYIFFPAVGGTSLGLLQVLGVPAAIQTFVGIVSMGVMLSSIAALFENRSSSFEMNRFRLKRNSTRVGVFILNVVLFTGCLVPVFLNLPDQSSAMYGWLIRVLKCPTEEYFTSPVFFLVKETFWGIYIAIVIAFEFCFTILLAIFFILCTWYYMFFSKHVPYSPGTRKLQKMFFVGNLIQIAIPALFWAVPFAAILTFRGLQFYNQSIINIGMCFISLHGLAAMIVVLTIHKPYRSFVTSVFDRKTTGKVTSKSNSVLV